MYAIRSYYVKPIAHRRRHRAPPVDRPPAADPLWHHDPQGDAARSRRPPQAGGQPVADGAHPQTVAAVDQPAHRVSRGRTGNPLDRLADGIQHGLGF